MNTPLNKSREIRLNPSNLIAKIQDMLRDTEECGLCIKTMEDFSDKGIELCIYLLKENKKLDLVKLILEHSKQNGIPYGIDLNQDLGDGKTILSYIIKYGNYKLFELINTLVFSLKGLHRNTISDLTIFSNGLEVTDRLLILDEIIKSGFQIRFLDVVNIIRFSEAQFLRIIGESSCSKKILNPKFIKLIFEHYNELLKQKPDMSVELVTIFARNGADQALNGLSEQEIEIIVTKELEELV